MQTTPININLSRFTDFVATDHLGQVVKLREIQKQFDEPYGRGGDFWAQWRERVAAQFAAGLDRSEIAVPASDLYSTKQKPYESACAGLGRFIGRKRVQFAGVPTSSTWNYERLNVRLNPDIELVIDGERFVIKWHLKQGLPLNQRMVNPLVSLLQRDFGDDHRKVMIVDVHRGKGFVQTRSTPDFETTLRMQAASFILGWTELESRKAA